MSFSGSSLSRCSSWAMIRLATVSSIGVPRKMIRSFSSREKMSKERSPRLVCSMTIGTRFASAMGPSGRRCERSGTTRGYQRSGPAAGGPERVALGRLLQVGADPVDRQADQVEHPLEDVGGLQPAVAALL